MISIYKGVYCSGWVSTGPVGVILTTMTNGFDVGKLILSDLADGKLQLDTSGKADILRHLEKTGIN